MVRNTSSKIITENIENNNSTEIKMSEDFLESLKDEKVNLEFPRASKLTEKKTKQILAKIQEKYSLTQEQAITGLAILFQQGGTAKKCDGNLTAKIFGKEIKLSEIRAILRIEGVKGNERKLARSLATPIYKVAKKLELQGNLAKPILRENTNLKLGIQELTWLSDFQNENEDVPESLKQLINEYFKQNKTNKPEFRTKRKTGK